MEQLIVALLGASLTLTIYFDRQRRGEIRALRGEIRSVETALRSEMSEGFDTLRGEIRSVDKTLCDEIRAVDETLRSEMQAGFASQTAALSDLAQSVGRVEGRTETFVERA